MEGARGMVDWRGGGSWGWMAGGRANYAASKKAPVKCACPTHAVAPPSVTATLPMGSALAQRRVSGRSVLIGPPVEV